jgi:hypothetical protein
LNFDAVAQHYDRLERWFSRGLMHQARTAHLEYVNGCREALLLGEGPGRFLPLVLQRFPNASVTCIDSSARMLNLARDTVPVADIGRVSFLEADLRHWRSNRERYDLIVTNFVLDCFDADELAEIIPRFADAATSDANWLIADFNLPESGFDRLRAALIVGVLYRFFAFAAGLSARCLVSPQPWLELSGFRLERRVELDHRLLRSDWWTRRPTSK